MTIERIKYLIYNILYISLIILGFQGCIRSSMVGDVQVKWKDPVSDFPKALWGVNDYEITDINDVRDPEYQHLMREISPELIRVHYGYIADEFTDSLTRTWDEELVVNCFQEAKKAYGNAKLMVNPVAKWPEWLADKNDPLTENQEKELIDLFKDFLRITKDHDIKVDYWEILNERENLYHENGQLPRLWNLFNRIVNEMRAIDPEIIIGGPAITYPQEPHFSSFLDSCGSNIDFISWHNYASPDPSTSTEFILTDAVATIDSFANYAIAKVEEKNLTNIKEFFLTEFNIQWTWEPFETRHANHIGAIYMGLVVDKLSNHPVSGITVWHFKGHSYGIVGKRNEMRPAGYLYEWGNHSLFGKRYGVNYKVDSIRNYLHVIPVENEEHRSVLLMNSSADQLFNLVLSDLSFNNTSEVNILCMDETRHSPDTIKVNSPEQEIIIPPHSLIYINTNIN